MATSAAPPTGPLLTPKCRLSYPNLFQPLRPNQSGVVKYSCALIFKREDMTSPLFVAMGSAAKEALHRRFGAKLPSNLKKGIRDGAEKESAGYGPGVVFFNTTAQLDYPPKLVGPDGKPLTSKSAWYPGCYVRALVMPYAYDNSGNKGVAFGLRGLQWLEDGEPLGSVGGDAEFEAVPGAAPPRVDSFAPAPSGAPEAEPVADEDIPF